MIRQKTALVSLNTGQYKLPLLNYREKQRRMRGGKTESKGYVYMRHSQKVTIYVIRDLEIEKKMGVKNILRDSGYEFSKNDE